MGLGYHAWDHEHWGRRVSEMACGEQSFQCLDIGKARETKEGPCSRNAGSACIQEFRWGYGSSTFQEKGLWLQGAEMRNDISSGWSVCSNFNQFSH